PTRRGALAVIERRRGHLVDGRRALEVALLEIEDVDLPAGAAVAQDVGFRIEKHIAQATPAGVLDRSGVMPRRWDLQIRGRHVVERLDAVGAQAYGYDERQSDGTTHGGTLRTEERVPPTCLTGSFLGKPRLQDKDRMDLVLGRPRGPDAKRRTYAGIIRRLGGRDGRVGRDR